MPMPVRLSEYPNARFPLLAPLISIIQPIPSATAPASPGPFLLPSPAAPGLAERRILRAHDRYL